VISSPHELYGRENCGCTLIRRSAGDGWYFYEFHGCRAHPWRTTSLWMAPCDCALSGNGERALCERHEYVAPFQRTAGGLH